MATISPQHQSGGLIPHPLYSSMSLSTVVVRFLCSGSSSSSDSSSTSGVVVVVVVAVVMIVMIIMIIIIIIIVIAFKVAIGDFLQSPHSAANCLLHVRSSGPGAIVCKSRATHQALITCSMCFMPRGRKGQLSY